MIIIDFGPNLSLLLLAAALVIPSSGVAASKPAAGAHKLAALCRGENVKLRTIEQLNALVGQVDSVGDDCTKRVKDAIRALGKLTQKSETGICTQSKAMAIIQFADRYLKRNGKKGEIQLPKPLVKFGIAYGMEVSGICGRLMIKKFGAEALSKLMYDVEWLEEVHRIYWLLSDESPLGMLLSPIIKTGELILPVDLMQAIPGLADHVGLLMPRLVGLDKFKLICERAFQPLYEPVLLPLAHLIRAGFNNRASYWQWKWIKQGRFWSRVVFLCEIAKMMHIDTARQAEISYVEEAEIVADLVATLKGSKRVKVIDWNVKQPASSFSMKEMPPQTGNTIYGQFDFHMQSLVKQFDPNKDHVELIRERIFERSYRVLRKMFQMHGFRALVDKLVDSIEIERGTKTEMDEVRKQLTSLIHTSGHSSRAYKLLVRVPKRIKDLLAVVTYGVVLALPTVVIQICTSLNFKEKYFDFVENLATNWLHINSN